jgi:hypothetical protein
VWNGNYNQPLTLNKWLYVRANPVNFVDPNGLWDIAPGFTLSSGGIYGKGLLTMAGSPKACSGVCWDSSSTTMPIFVPQLTNGVLYNDVMFAHSEINYNGLDISFHSQVYDAIERMRLGCKFDGILVPMNSNDWQVVYQHSGKSHAFSAGAGLDFATFVALGSGFDQGWVPIDITFPYPDDVNFSVALAMWQLQSEQERRAFNLVEIWDKSSRDRDTFTAIFGGANFMVQSFKGAAAYLSRPFNVIIQEHRRAPQFYRAILETMSAIKDLGDDSIYIVSKFVSFTDDRWQEDYFNVARSR